MHLGRQRQHLHRFCSHCKAISPQGAQFKTEFNCQGLNLWCWGQPQETMPSSLFQQIHIPAIRNVLPLPSYSQSQKSAYFRSLNTDLNGNSCHSSPTPCIINLGVSRPHILAAVLQSKKSCCWHQNTYRKCQRAHHNSFMLLSLTPTKKVRKIFLVLNYVNKTMSRTIIKRNGHRQKAWKA